MSQPETLRENKMGTMPIGKLLVQMALPMILSMLVQALYNVVDSIYVSQISESAMTALALAFPIQNLQIGFATGIAVGVTALASKSLGSKDYDRANQAAAHGVFLVAIAGVLFMLFGGFLAGPFYAMQSDVAETVEGGTSYLRICTLVSVGIFGEVLFERLLQSSGRTVYTLVTQGTGAVLNILLDPVFIFGKFGMPRMGVTGAAVATVLGQCVAFLLALYFNTAKNRDIKISFRGFRPRLDIIQPILAVAVPSIVMMSVGSAMTFGVNQILQSFNETATTVFGVYFKLQSFVFMPIFGLNNAMIPVVAFNYGARQPKRIVRSVLYCAIAATCVMLAGLLLFQLAPGLLLAPFNPSEQFLTIGSVALRTISVSFLFAGFCIVLGAAFQALGNGIYSTLVSIARQLVVLLPVAYLLGRTGRLELVWLAFPIAEVVSMMASLFFAYRLFRQKIRPLYPHEKLSRRDLM